MRSSSAETEAGSRVGAWAGLSFRLASVGDVRALARRAKHLVTTWRGLNPLRRYIVAAVSAVAVFTAISGIWVSTYVAHGIASNRAQPTVVLIQDIVTPLMQALPPTRTLPPDVAATFDNLISAPGIATHVPVMRLWSANGELVYRSDRPKQSLPASPAAALDLASLQKQISTKLIEINVPIHATGTHKTLAVAQLFGIADTKDGALSWARAQTWLLLTTLALAMMAAPYRIVQSASHRIDQLQQDTADQKAEVSRLTAQNETLRRFAEMIHRRGMEHSERTLRRIGSDLHDGPAQHLALVLLRLDELAPPPNQRLSDEPSAYRSNTLEVVRKATSDALKEIRHISAGLALPELQKISLKEALLIAVRAHQRATGTSVKATFDNLPPRLPLPMTICLYRFAQEALNNAFRHAGGKGQQLSASYDGQMIFVEIADDGPGFAADRISASGEHLGLSGLRYRVESLGGSLHINSTIGQGTALTVRFSNPLA